MSESDKIHKLFFYYSTNKTENEGKSVTISLIFLYLASILAAFATGKTVNAGAAVLEGARAALDFVLALGGAICLWSAMMELLEQSGLAAALAALLRPLLRRLYPRGGRDGETLSALSENLSANLLGLGNAATPAGIRAAKGLRRLGANRELRTLVVLNTASVQLLPTTSASLRASLGSAAPFDIVPAVWLSSALSVLVGLAALKLLDRGGT